MNPTVADIIGILEKIAPPDLAEAWDNCGLQVGSRKKAVTSVLISLDPLPRVISHAVSHGFDMLITHHPLIFRPIHSIDDGNPSGSLILETATHGLALYSAHTNLDKAEGGVNDVLVEKIGLSNIEPFIPHGNPMTYKLIIFTPRGYEEKILSAIHQSGAGKIGNYSCCTFRTEGTGTFIPGSSTNPFSGTKGELSQVNESRIETIVSGKDLTRVIETVRNNHPYETMAYDVYPLSNGASSRVGLGRTGELGEPLPLKNLAEKIREKLNAPLVTFAGNPNLMVKKVAVCSGSGSSLMKQFLSSDAEVYISGDFGYHQARDAEAAGRGLIDLGHFPSEHPVVEALAEKLKKQLVEKRLPVSVACFEQESDPFIRP